MKYLIIWMTLALAAASRAFAGPPADMVLIDNQFYIDKYEVTAEQYDKFCVATGRNKPFGEALSSGKMPANNVTWYDAMEYAKWAGKRLPTEDEWVKAAKGPEKADKPKDLDQAAWYDKNSGGKLHPVGQKKPNGYGLYDMFGNAWEWCTGFRISKENKSTRGGSACDKAGDIRAFSNSWHNSVDRYKCGGFRCAANK